MQAAFVQADADHDVICPSYEIADLLPDHGGASNLNLKQYLASLDRM